MAPNTILPSQDPRTKTVVAPEAGTPGVGVGIMLGVPIERLVDASPGGAVGSGTPGGQCQ
jgi:hypothetical protein